MRIFTVGNKEILEDSIRWRGFNSFGPRMPSEHYEVPNQYASSNMNTNRMNANGLNGEAQSQNVQPQSQSGTNNEGSVQHHGCGRRGHYACEYFSKRTTIGIRLGPNKRLTRQNISGHNKTV
jgi:hypothetical protein